MWTFLGAAAVATLLTACSDSSPTRSAPPPPALQPETTPSTAPSTTTPAPSTTATSRLTTTAPAPASPERSARTLFDAWAGADRAAAMKVAQPQAVDALFARTWQAADGWTFSECSGAAGSLICTWRRPAGQQLLMRVLNATGGVPISVAEVRFQP